jgi:hypothetical protein
MIMISELLQLVIPRVTVTTRGSSKACSHADSSWPQHFKASATPKVEFFERFCSCPTSNAVEFRFLLMFMQQ